MNKALRLALREWCKALHNEGTEFGSDEMRLDLIAFRSGWRSCKDEIVYIMES